MKFRTEFLMSGDFYESTYVNHDIYEGEYWVNEVAEVPCNFKKGEEHFNGALKVKEIWSEFDSVTDEDFHSKSRSGQYSCRHVGYITSHVYTNAVNSEEASEKANLLLEEFMNIAKENIDIEDLEVEEKETIQISAESKTKGA